MTFFSFNIKINDFNYLNIFKNNTNMGKDYYGTLKVPALATSIDISKSFRILALQYHPKK